MSFCTKCGQKLEVGSKFCTSCGAPVAATGQPGAPAAVQPPAAPPQAFAPVKKRSGVALLLIVLGVLGLLAVIGIGGVVYVGYMVKEKVTSVAQSVAHPAPNPGENKAASPGASNSDDGNKDVSAILGNLGSMLGGGDDDGDPVESISAKDPVIPCTPAPFPAQTAARIPLQAATTVTTAWGIKNGDVEGRMSIVSVGPTSVSMRSVSEAYKDDDGHDWKSSGSPHTVCNGDFATADTFATVTGLNMPEIVHGLTRLRLSDKSFQEVKSAGKTYLVYWDVLSNGDSVKPTHSGGVLTRVEAQDVSYPMIVNDQRVNLPAVHLTGIIGPGRKRSHAEEGSHFPLRGRHVCDRRPTGSAGSDVQVHRSTCARGKVQGRSHQDRLQCSAPGKSGRETTRRTETRRDLGNLLRLQQRHDQAGIRAGAETDRAGDDGQPGLEAYGGREHRQYWR